MVVNIEVQSLCVPYNLVRGIPQYTKNLIKNLLQNGNNEYTFSLFDYNNERGNRNYFLDNLDVNINKDCILENNTVDYRKIKEAIGNKNLSFFKGVGYADYFPKRKWDIIHLPSHLNIPYNLSEQAVVTVHDILPLFDEKKLIYDLSRKPGFSHGMEFLRDSKTRIISVSEYTKEKIIEFFDIQPERIDVIHNGYNRDFYHKKVDEYTIKKYNIEGQYLLYLGAIQRRKDMYSALKAFEIVKEKKKDIKIVFAGNKVENTDDFYNMVSKSNYRKDIIVTGYVTEEEKRSLMSGAEVFVFPSLAEGFGLPIIEAMACETPVITTNQTSLPEVGGDAALYVPPRRPDLIADYIISLLENESLRLGCIKKGIKQKEKFSWERCSRETEEIYKKMK